VNLAIALAKLGHRIGLMDADVYGPNVPLMLGLRAAPKAQGERIIPLEKHRMKVMSMGYLNPGDKPLIWRGPMLHSVIQQFLRGVEWGQLDFLLNADISRKTRLRGLASMGPRSADRGNCRCRRVLYSEGQCFNGAAIS
jgi:hypothetical protein